MTQVYHNRAETQYVEKLFCGRYPIMVPTFQRFPRLDYEPKRCLSMEQNLQKGDILFDIGVSDGWLSAIYASFVGAENMCLFEPSYTAWANIKADWDANKLAQPKSTFWGFVSDTTHLVPPDGTIENEILEYKDGWPLSAFRETLIEEACFRSLLSTGRNIPQTTVDNFVRTTDIYPDALSIDVEGAELLVLKGAREVMTTFRPKIWLSLHDLSGALTYDYNTTKEEVFAFLTACNYKTTWLEDYGDSHWLCESY